MITPRDYQADALPAMYKYWRENPGHYPLIVMPTAGGKTIVFSLLIADLMQKYHDMSCLVLAHRKELIGQTESKLLEVWPEAETGIYSAALKRREINKVTIASRDTLGPALKKFDYAPRIVIIDEAHNISAKEESRYRKIITELEARNPRLMVVGVTATPFRQGNGLIYGEGQLFSAIGYQVKMRQLLDQGHILPIKSVDVDDKAKIDTTDVAISGGEFNQKQLALESEKNFRVQAAVADWHQKAWLTGRKHTLFFCVSIAHAQAVVKEIATYGLEVPMVTGTTSDTRRDAVNRDMLARKLPGVVNVGVYTEGTDFPMIDCIANMRAIHSLNLWMQIVGRLMRIDLQSEFTHGLMLDYGGCVERFGPIDIAMPPERRGKRTTTPRTKICPKCKSIVGFYKLKCIKPCDHEFKKRPTRECPNCHELCDPKAGECPACGEIFVSHGIDASRGDMLSSPDRFQTLKVTRLSTRIEVSRAKKLPYLLVQYHTEALDIVCKKFLCFGYPGSPHDRAVNDWLRMTRPELELMTPATPKQAYAIGVDWQQAHWRPVESVLVDKYDKYKAIVAVHYAQSPPLPTKDSARHDLAI